MLALSRGMNSTFAKDTDCILDASVYRLLPVNKPLRDHHLAT